MVGAVRAGELVPGRLGAADRIESRGDHDGDDEHDDRGNHDRDSLEPPLHGGAQGQPAVDRREHGSGDEKEDCGPDDRLRGQIGGPRQVRRHRRVARVEQAVEAERERRPDRQEEDERAQPRGTIGEVRDEHERKGDQRSPALRQDRELHQDARGGEEEGPQQRGQLPSRGQRQRGPHREQEEPGVPVAIEHRRDEVAFDEGRRRIGRAARVDERPQAERGDPEGEPAEHEQPSERRPAPEREEREHDQVESRPVRAVPGVALDLRPGDRQVAPGDEAGESAEREQDSAIVPAEQIAPRQRDDGEERAEQERARIPVAGEKPPDSFAHTMKTASATSPGIASTRRIAPSERLCGGLHDVSTLCQWPRRTPRPDPEDEPTCPRSRQTLKRRLPPGLRPWLRKLGRLRWHAKYRNLKGAGITLREQPGTVLRHVLVDPEVDNYTYELENADETAPFVAEALGVPLEEAQRYVHEAETDPELNEELTRRVRWRFSTKRRIPLGRRVIWYAIVRLTRPQLMVECGVQEGLGSLVLLRALERNAAEGAEGRLLSIEPMPKAGWLVPERLRERWQLVTAPSEQALPAALEGMEVGVLLSDSGGSYERELLEYDSAHAHGSPELVLIAACGDHTPALPEFSARHGLRYSYFAERPKGHFFGGSAVGVAVRTEPAAAD